MKSFYLATGETLDVFNELKNISNGKLTLDNNEYNLKLNSDIVKGTIQGVTYPEGMAYLEFDMLFNDDIMLSVEPFSTSPIFFIYCFQGHLKHSVGIQGDKIGVEKEHTGILKSISAINTILYFEKNIPIKFAIVGIETNKNTNTVNELLVQRLRNTFFNKNENDMSIRFQNLDIIQKIKELKAINQQGRVRNLFKKRILESIVAMEIELHTDSFSELSQSFHSMVLKRMDKIKKISNDVVDLPARLNTVVLRIHTELRLLVDRLQKEFKLVSNRTVHDFLNFIRIHKQRI